MCRRDRVDLTLRVAAGERTAGERAGHAQVKTWGNWRQGGEGEIERGRDREKGRQGEGEGMPLATKAPAQPLEFVYEAIGTPKGPVFEQVGLIVPTSLCAAQVAHMAASRLNRKQVGIGPGRTRYVALVHTEGCTDSTGEAIAISTPTLLGYATHPAVGRCLLLEHGCEVSHNDYMQQRLLEQGGDLQAFGWASVQLDGGIVSALDKVEAWFAATAATDATPLPVRGTLASLRIGLLATAPLPARAARALAKLAANLAAAGGSVVVAESGYLLHTPAFVDGVLADPGALWPTLPYACLLYTSRCV